MAKSEKQVPELIAAAETLENELASIELLSKSVRKIRLNSEKNLTRASKELTEALVVPERLAEGLRTLAAAMRTMQERQQAALEPLAAFAAEIEQRKQRLAEHMQSFATLGEAAGKATALLQASGEPAGTFNELDALLAKIAEGARALLDLARADDFPDVAREADALGQRVSALRKRLPVTH
ncbi:MAG TPA: hypothetical protein VGM29_15395 [Polyangiaceae bacterium]|jgi:ABC-type transporter Mla subunit MlaD